MATANPAPTVLLTDTHERSYNAYQTSCEKHVSLYTEAERSQAEALFIHDPMAWGGETLGDDFIIHLNQSDVDEITKAANTYAKSGRSFHLINRQSFPLPRLEVKLQETRRQLHSYPGIVLLRGLRPQTGNPCINIITLAGVSAHVSEQRGRQVGARYLIHIKDLANVSKDAARVAPYSSKFLPLHTDRGDLVSMYVLSATGGQGGEGTFASVAEVTRRIARRAPQIIQELMAPSWPFDVPGDITSTRHRPILFVQDGVAEMNFSRANLTKWASSQKSPNYSQMSAEQCEALEWVQWTGVECGIKLQYQDGDLVIFNNRRILHGREQFSELEIDCSKSRHILRLWLRDTPMAGLPQPPLQEHYSKIFEPPSTIGGAGELVNWPLEPFTMLR